jgi:hypothetical protein
MRSIHPRSFLRFFAVSSLAAGVLCVASSASAQSQPHTHDGFYLRLGAGFAYQTTSEDPDSAKIKGTGSAYVLSIGGTPVPGLAIAGTIYTVFQPKPSVTLGNQTVDANSALWMTGIGPIVDYYFDPSQGFHLGGGPLYTTLNAVNYTATGYGLTAFTGYDFWIGNQWSVGPTLQLAYAHTSKDAFSDSATSVSLMVTFLDH